MIPSLFGTRINLNQKLKNGKFLLLVMARYRYSCGLLIHQLVYRLYYIRRTLLTLYLIAIVCAFSVTIPFPLPKCVRNLVSRLLVRMRIRHAHTDSTVENNANVSKVNTDTALQERRTSRLHWHRLPIDFVTLPPVIVLLLLAIGVLSPADMRTGITGSGGVHPISIMSLFISLVSNT